MSLANRVRWYLDHHGIDYEVVHHELAETSLEAGLKAHVPPGRVAKGVLLEDVHGYVLAILPAACRLQFDAIEDVLDRRLELATEPEIGEVFPDCAHGAVPATGRAYNVPMLVDESLLRLPDLYFEGGDHEDFVHVEHDAFEQLVGDAWHGRIGKPN
jgi:Ala-tRNA(Pro) deacylase